MSLVWALEAWPYLVEVRELAMAHAVVVAAVMPNLWEYEREYGQI